MKLCYIEDCLGGTICYPKDKGILLAIDKSAKVVFEGTKEELEKYLGHEITKDNISYVGRE